MSRFMIITLLAVIATTSAKPYVVAYPSRFYGGYLAPAYNGYDYPVFSYPYTPVTYVETVPVTTVVGGPPPVAAVPVAAKLVAKNGGPPPKAPSGRLQLPAPPPPRAPSARQELPAPPPPPPPPPPAPPAPPAAPPAPPKGPVKVIITKEFLGLPDLDPSKLLEALPIQQLLDLPPVKKIVELKTNKLQTIMGLKNTLQGVLQEKLAPIAALLP